MAITEVSRVPAKGGVAMIVTLRDGNGNITVNTINLKDMQTGSAVDLDVKVAHLISTLGG